MADFPENEIEILSLPDILNELMAEMQSAISAADIEITGAISGPNKNLVTQIHSDRAGLGRFLKRLASDPVLGSNGILEEIGTDFKKGKFADAQPKIEELAAKLPNVRRAPVGQAFHPRPVMFKEIIKVDPGGERGPKPGPVVIEERTLPGYKGPTPEKAQVAQVLAWSIFLSQDTDLLLVGLLAAETDAGLRKFQEAINSYDNLLKATPPGSPRQKFLALRSAFARLARGDQLFRKQRTLSDQARQNIIDIYDAAVRLLQETGVSPDNPRRQEIEAHATQQKAKLQNGLNYLGLWDAFVPVQKFSHLELLAEKHIEDAAKSADDFQKFLDDAEKQSEAQKDIDFQRGQEESTLAVLALRRANSTLSVDKIKEQLSAIDDQEKFLAVKTVEEHFRVIIEGAAKGNPVTPLGGFADNLINFLDQSEQLAHQRRTAKIEQQIAENEVRLAKTEIDMSAARIDFYKQKLAFLHNKRLNADFLYLLAELNEKRAERRLDVAIFLAYLFERAVALFLGEPNIRRIQFDYRDRPEGIFKAAEALRDDFRLVQQEFAKPTEAKIDFFVESISLRQFYPIQFSQFLQTGNMDFVYSLYQLSKRRPASHQCRLREVGVQIEGLIPSTGFSGTLTHRGRFLVRDRLATLLDPDATRLIPTDEQLARALEEQRRQGSAVAAVGGVMYYNLDPDTKELSQHTQFVSQVPPEQFTLGLFEGHGPTGLWHLEIQDHGRLAITDILLHFAIVSRESEIDVLQPKIEDLIRKYEAELAQGDQLDRISVFSLRQNFPDTFFALQTGRADLNLNQEDFEDGLTNLKTKMVIAQALDQAGKAVPGVALEIARPEFGFKQARVTRTDGFSEDLDVPPQTLPRDQRFPVIGGWQIRLSNPAQFTQLGDLRVFFMYAFEEV